MWCSCVVYVSYWSLYVQCVWYMYSLCVEEVASVFSICGVCLVSVVCMWSGDLFGNCCICVE